MAAGIEFPYQNTILGAPAGSPEVKPLHCFRDGEQFISCWKLTPEEIEEVIKTGVVWVYVMGNAHPPLYLTGNMPFTVQKN